MRRITWFFPVYIILGLALAIASGASRSYAQSVLATAEISASRIAR
jgi:hypothetical protein